MSLPYIGKNNSSNFKQVPLKDASSNEFGNVYLCVRTDLPQVTAVPAAVGGVPFPNMDNPGNNPFLDKFASIANQVGQQLVAMNDALVNMHAEARNGGTISTDNYLGAAKAILQAIGLMQSTDQSKKFEYWPLVPINDDNHAIPINPSLPRPAIVSTLNVGNGKFPGKPNHTPGNTPGRENALFFPVSVAANNDAVGMIVLFQDCEWDESAPTSNKRWSSWGFITNYSLTLIQSVSTEEATAMLTAGVSSSSSSSYYAASSSMPGK